VLLTGREAYRRATIHPLKIDVTASCNELLRNGVMPFCDRDVEGGAPNTFLKVDVTARSKELLFCDGFIALFGRDV
jgi:hypothetical protein